MFKGGVGGMNELVCHFGSQFELWSFSLAFVTTLSLNCSTSLTSTCIWRLDTMWPSTSSTSLVELRNFHQLPDPVWAAFVEAAGDPGDDLKAMGALPPNLLATCLTSARMADGERLTTIQASQVGMVFRAARRNLHVQSGGDVAHWTDPNPWETMSPKSPTASSPASASATPERKMKYLNILDQSDESEFTILDDKVHGELMEKYIKLVGGLPAPEEEPTREQLSALQKKVYVLLQPPYADYAVFTAYGRKFMKAMKYRTFLPTMEGGYISKEVPGPSTHSQWLSSFRVWRTALIMLEVMDMATLQRYELLVENMVKLLPGCWHLIVSADDRARSEHMSRLQMKVQMDHNNGDQVPKGWTKDRPCWGPILKLVIDDHAFWQEHVHGPAMIWMAYGRHGKPRTPAEHHAAYEIPGGESALKADTEEIGLQGSQSSQGSPSKRQQANRDRRDARKKRLKNEREELTRLRQEKGGGGKGKGKGKTESGEQLCFSWNNNNGQCAGLAPGSECKGKIKRIHKCTRCMSPGHPSVQCPKKE